MNFHLHREPIDDAWSLPKTVVSSSSSGEIADDFHSLSVVRLSSARKKVIAALIAGAFHSLLSRLIALVMFTKNRSINKPRGRRLRNWLNKSHSISDCDNAHGISDDSSALQNFFSSKFKTPCGRPATQISDVHAHRFAGFGQAAEGLFSW